MREDCEEIIFWNEERKEKSIEASEGKQAFGKPKHTETYAVEKYLSDYRTYAEMIRMNHYEREYFSDRYRKLPDAPEESENYLRRRLYEIRSFILSLPDSDEKLLLYYRYVHGESVTDCAELLGISRAGAYRLYRRALTRAADYFSERQKIAR